MTARSWAADQVAARLLSGPWTAGGIASGLTAVIGPDRRVRRRALVVQVVALGTGPVPPAHGVLAATLIVSPFFRPPPDRGVAAVLDPPRFAPAEAFRGLPIPALTTPGDLADWLDVPAAQVDWLSDERRGHGRTREPVFQHYRLAILAKRSGLPRLVEAPKPRLKAIQRRLLHEILAHVPVHGCAKGFVAGRSCLDGAQIHVGEALVATFDLTQFFPSIGAPRVHGLFRRLGYPSAVARRLTGLCTTVTPASALEGYDAAIRQLHGRPHLAQGAPTSPALANLVAWTLDRRLHGLARAYAANYSRYADDLAFSGDAALAARSGMFQRSVEAIVREEGFLPNAAKTRIMPDHARQCVTGIVVNAHCNAGRAAFDRLKAMLHNCVHRGPGGENRGQEPDFRRHLDGRIVWVERLDMRRGAKLRRLFDAIDWGERDDPAVP